MAAKKLSKKELQKEDEFVSFSTRALMYARAHAKKFKIAGAAVGVIVVVYLCVWGYLGHVDRKGQAAYNEAYYALLQGLSQPQQDPVKLKGVEEGFRKVIDQYSLSGAGRLAYPELAHLKFTEKKYDEAIPLYQAYLKEFPAASLYHSLAQLALAGCYEGKGETEKAVEALKGVLSGPEDAASEIASFSLARLYRASGQVDKSRETLKAFAEKYKDSPFLPMAKAFLEKDIS
jgi:predicted negative regulator of RcsB-dependent stress response